MTKEENLYWLNKEIEGWENECQSKHPVKEALYAARRALEQEPILDRIRAEIEQKLEQEEFARSVFRHEEKDNTKAEQCTGSILAYRDVLKMFDKYKAESEG